MRLIFGSLSGLVLLTTLASACGGQAGSEVTPGGNADGTGAGASGGIVLGGSDGLGLGNGSGVVVDPTTACATGTASATLSGVNMFVMFDRSSSMNQSVGGRGGRGVSGGGATRWELTSNALTAFFASPDAAGLQLALRFFPHDLPAMGCNQTDCDEAACAAPFVDLGTLTADTAPADKQEKALVDATRASAPGMSGQGTPIYAALGGALQWAKAQRKKTPNENSVVVLVTDGQPNGCTTDIGEIAKLARDAFASDGIRTYAIGLTGSREGDMDEIANAGGTTKGIFVSDGDNTQQDLLDALGTIRGQVLDCDFPVPEAKAGTEVNLAEINVNFTPTGGKQVTLGQVGSAAKCTGTAGWYYDDPAVPKRIVLCPSACDAVTADSMAKLEILLGCATVPSVPR